MSPSSIQSARALVAFETTISLSPHATSNAVTPIELESVVDILRAGDAHGKLTAALAGFTGRDRAKITGFGFQDHIAQIRATYAAAKCRAAGYADPGDVIHAAKEAVSKLKKALPGFLFSGSFSRRANNCLQEHSGLICVDVDDGGMSVSLEQTFQGLTASPYLLLQFRSPTGVGLKAVFRVPRDSKRHMDSCWWLKHHIYDMAGAHIDAAARDIARLCFLSHDSDLYFNAHAEEIPHPPPAPYNAWQQPAKAVHLTERIEPAPDSIQTSAEPSIIVLPSGAVSITESARVIFERMAPTRTLFWRGGALVELVDVNGVANLEVLKPDKFRSDVEKLAPLFAWRSAGKDQPVLKPAKMSLDDSRAILAASEGRELLPPIAGVVRCSVLIESGPGQVTVLGRGYHPEMGGLLVIDGDTPPRVPLSEAVRSLHRVLEEFAFQTEADRSRALAAMITPALRIGGHLGGNVPIDCAEADQSQSGKGYRHNLVCALYNESSYFVTAKAGGVGSVDESFATALIAGRPFICLDNFRGRMDSQNLEAFLTCPSLFPARIPHRGEALIDPRRFILQLSSNGLETTRDLANRASICRIRKRPGFTYRDTLTELRDRQPYYLGCVFAVIGEWIANGKPRTTDTRHDFREWAQSLDWIVQQVFGGAPLMEGHEAAQERSSTPALSWLRSVALVVEREGRLGQTFTASDIVDLCDQGGIDIPGNPKNAEEAKKQVGRMCSRVFSNCPTVVVDGFRATRTVTELPRVGGGKIQSKIYVFSKP